METFIILAALAAGFIFIGNKITQLGYELSQLKVAIRQLMPTPPVILQESTQPVQEEKAPEKSEPEGVKEEVQEKQTPVPPPFVALAQNEVAAQDGQAQPLPLQRPEQPQRPPKSTTIEKWVGENLFGKLGILIFVLGIGFFVKYAIDKNWINEAARTSLGFLTGGALLGIAYWLRNRYRTYSSLLAGGAFATFFITDSIAFNYYHLFTPPAAFAILVVATMGMTALSIVYDRRELAIIALIGGFTAPFLVTSEQSNSQHLMIYLTILNVGMTTIASLKKWGEIVVLACLSTWLIMCILPKNDNPNFDWIMLSTSIINFLLFMVSTHSITRNRRTSKGNRFLAASMILNDFAFLFTSGYTLEMLTKGVNLYATVCAFIIMVHSLLLWGMWKDRESHKLLFNLNTALMAAAAAIAIPLQFDGDIIPLAWAVETAILCWLFIKSQGRGIFEAGTCILLLMTGMTFLLRMTKTLQQGGQPLFLNSWFMTAITASIAVLLIALMAEKHGEIFKQKARLIKTPEFTIIAYSIGCAMTYASFMVDFNAALKGQLRYATMAMFTAAFILAAYLYFARKLKFTVHRWLLETAAVASLVTYMANVWGSGGAVEGSLQVVFQWATAMSVIALLALLAIQWGKRNERKLDFTLTLSIAAMLTWITMSRQFLWLVGVQGFSAGLSVSLGIGAFALMIQGMRLHYKDLRTLSLAAFGIVLGKLVFFDLWSMPPIGKIITFICLGAIMLVLAFMYQRLKNVLFGEDQTDEKLNDTNKKSGDS